MLKGINIGGKNRLEYLNCLKKRLDDNIEILEKRKYDEYKVNKNDELENEILDENNNKKNDNYEDSPLIDGKNNDNENNTKNNNDIEYEDEIIDLKIDYYKKFEEESNFIDKEYNFYEFDEQLLQCRSLEIDCLLKVLIDLKGALLLTSCNQQVETIINYSSSEEIFKNLKNKGGATICESNIGNLQSQLLKYDKAIFHLVTSLQDNKLKKNF